MVISNFAAFRLCGEILSMDHRALTMMIRVSNVATPVLAYLGTCAQSVSWLVITDYCSPETHDLPGHILVSQCGTIMRICNNTRDDRSNECQVHQIG